MKKTGFLKRAFSVLFAVVFCLVAIPTVEAQAATDVTVHFKNVPGWSAVCAYTWGAGDLFGSWPGTDITATADADGYYTATLEAFPKNRLNIIFNNGNNGDQTVDLVCDVSMSAEWWVVPTDNGSGQWACTVAISKAEAEAGKSTEIAPEKPLIPENPTISASPVVNGNEVTFYFESEVAKEVVIAGSMNEWSTDWTMTKDGNVFSYTATISEGTYQYKYIVDGEWMTDPFNANTVKDNDGNTNSTFEVKASTGDTTPEDTTPEDTTPEDTQEKPDETPEKPLIPENPTIKNSPVINGNEVTFYFESEIAKEIVIAGSMNGWSTDWTMTKNGNVFSYTATIPAGSYQYKYIVDGEWMTDPFNSNTIKDAEGNTNSTFEVTASSGETTPENPTPENPAPENPTPELPLIPENPTIKNSPVVNGNEVTFYFESEIAKEIVISGSMNGWSTDWTMTKNGNVFSYTTTIPAGSYQYKYIVDGEWMTDPFNSNTVDDGSGNVNSTFEVTASSGETTPENPAPENPIVKASPVINGNEVTFYFESATASNVVISGSMNNWSTDWTMTKDGNVFSFTTTIEAGTYQYKYIVDGEWITDPGNANTVDDGSGNINSTFTVTATGTTPEPDTTPDTTPDETPDTEKPSTEETNTEDVQTEVKPSGLPMGVIIAISAIITFVVVVGGFAGFTFYQKKKA